MRYSFGQYWLRPVKLWVYSKRVRLTSLYANDDDSNPALRQISVVLKSVYSTGPSDSECLRQDGNEAFYDKQSMRSNNGERLGV